MGHRAVCWIDLHIFPSFRVVFSYAGSMVSGVLVPVGSGVVFGSVLDFSVCCTKNLSKDIGISAISSYQFRSAGDSFPWWYAQWSWGESVGFALGTGLSFWLAGWLLAEMMPRLTHISIPRAFRGTPAVFLYLAILALAFLGFAKV